MTLLDQPIASTRAQREASANFIANVSALAATQPQLSHAVLPPREQVEWVFGRDGSLTALDEDGNWSSGCSLPKAAGAAMLRKMDVNSPVACFLAPPHAAQVRIALDRLSPEQAIIVVVPEEAEIRLMLACENFSEDIAAHRLWFAAGPGWGTMLGSILTEQIGLAVPGQFLRLHATEESLIQNLIQEATTVFSRITHDRSNLMRERAERAVQPVLHGQKFCVVAPANFRLWNVEGHILAKAAPADSMLLNTSDPSLSSPLKLATTASACGALLAANFARADLLGVIPTNLPWLTWITNDRIPGFHLAGPRDRLLIAAPSVLAAATASGWPADRVHLAAWPQTILPTPAGKRILTVFTDTMPAGTPDDLEDFSSHRVLWETIGNELAKDPYSLEGDPGQFLAARMRRFDVSAESFPYDRFLSQLIMPAYQQSVVRALIKAGLPLRLHGQGWGELPEFASCLDGAINTLEEMNIALARATILVDLWPWRAAHPIGGFNRHVVRRTGRSLSTFIQQARNAVLGSTPVPPANSAPLCSDLLNDLLSRSLAK